MTMGERIRTLRHQHKMSMEELGSKIGVGRSAILKYEKGEVENLPRSTIEKMSIIFGVSPAYLMCFDEWDQNSEHLSDEVKLIERIQAKWGKGMVTLMQHYCELNDEGKEMLIDIAETMDASAKYQK